MVFVPATAPRAEKTNFDGSRLAARELNADGHSGTPNDPTATPRAAVSGEQQHEAIRQLLIAVEHETRAVMRNVRDRARPCRLFSVREDLR